MKALTLFSGFGGVDIALREAGFQVSGVEIDPALAEVNRRNGGDVITADVLEITENYIGWDLIHASPPCPSFSLAKVGAAETDLDLALAEKIKRFIVVCQPRVLTLENVWLYRQSQSWSIICEALKGMGYGVDWWRLNAADYGVPQARHRMIVVARWDGQRPQKPFPTHSKAPDMFTKPWRGWYEAIGDLIPKLPETQLAPWQWESLCKLDWFRKTFLLGHSSVNLGLAKINDPAFTVTTQSNRARAWINNSQNANRNLTIRDGGSPMFTVPASALDKNSPPKAFVVGGQYQSYQSPNDTPDRIVQHRHCDRPNWTITANDHLDTRCWLSCGKVVSMTTRCLARFQDFPDWFQLSGDQTLDCQGIGNALPPGVMRAVLQSLGIEGTNDQR